MANSVTSRVDIQCNEAAQVLVEKWVKAIETMDTVVRNGDSCKYVWNIMDNVPDEVTYEWTADNIGTKWCYFEDMYDNTFVMTSAWDWLIKFIDWMTTQILAIDEDATITVTYEDESPNFVGYHIYTKLGERGDAIDWDDLVQMVTEAIPEITELDEDSDAYFDMLHENIWDAVYKWQDDQIEQKGN